MNNDIWQKVRELFDAVIELPAGDRAEFLERHCGEDLDARREVEVLLSHDSSAGDTFLETPNAGAPAGKTWFDGQPQDLIGRTVGNFTIRALIGQGGMSVVYLADQSRPRRQVAIKIMNAGLVSRKAWRRFEYESEILARLVHPNIAHVYEAGTLDCGAGVTLDNDVAPGTPAGQRDVSPDWRAATSSLPYFAMEFVPNARTITQYARDHLLTQRQKIELFLQACDGVNHGHAHGVIHRDLKPANILVGVDGPGIQGSKGPNEQTANPTSSLEPSTLGPLGHSSSVKLIDFGIAQFTKDDTSRTTIHTEVHELMGTLQYMSPEQFGADPHDIDIRTDVYSLGVILFELLCGRPPYDLSHTTLASAARTVCDVVPPLPSAITGRKGLRGQGVKGPRKGICDTGVPPVNGLNAVAAGAPAGRSRNAAQPSTAVSLPSFAPSAPWTLKTYYCEAVRGDLERVVLKALEKDRTKRYASGVALAEDLRRWLAGEPVSVRRRTVASRVMDLGKRYPKFATAIIVAALFATGIVTYDRTYQSFAETIGSRIEHLPGKSEAMLVSRTGKVLHHWENLAGTEMVRFAQLLDDPFEKRRLAVMAFTENAQSRYRSKVCAFDVFDPANPVWAIGVERESIPSHIMNHPRGLDFSPSHAWAYDVFEEVEGVEIVVVFACTFSVRAIRIYDLKGDCLYRTWNDGALDHCRYNPKSGLLVFSGEDAELYCEQREGGKRGRYTYPRVIFALRPTLGAKEDHFLRRGYGKTEYRSSALAWHRCLLPLKEINRLKPIVLGPEVTVGSVGISFALHDQPDLGFSWELDAQGNSLPQTWVTGDVYQRALLAGDTTLPGRDTYFFGDLPPPVIGKP